MVRMNITEIKYFLIVQNLTMMEEIVMETLIGSKVNQNTLTEETQSDNKEDDQLSLMGSESEINEICPDCHGSGSLQDNTCSSCNGKGVI